MKQEDVKKELERSARLTGKDVFIDAYKIITEQEKEIKQLKAKNKVLGDGVAKAFTNGFNTGRKQVEKDIRRAQIDVLNELKDKMFEREYMGVKYKQGVFSESEIDNMIAEVQNAEDKG